MRRQDKVEIRGHNTNSNLPTPLAIRCQSIQLAPVCFYVMPRFSRREDYSAATAASRPSSRFEPRGLVPGRRRPFVRRQKDAKTPSPRGGHGTLNRSVTSLIASTQPDTGTAAPTGARGPAFGPAVPGATTYNFPRFCADVQRLLPITNPRAVAAGAGWMNDDQPDKLSEGALAPEFLSGRHSSVRRREPCEAGQDGRGPRRLIQTFRRGKVWPPSGRGSPGL
jgi:hypothetical protein